MTERRGHPADIESTRSLMLRSKTKLFFKISFKVLGSLARLINNLKFEQRVKILILLVQETIIYNRLN